VLILVKLSTKPLDFPQKKSTLTKGILCSNPVTNCWPLGYKKHLCPKTLTRSKATMNNLKSLRLLTSLSVVFLLTLFASSSFLSNPKLGVKGVIKSDKQGHAGVELTLIDSENFDSTAVELRNGRFDLDLDFEKHYLLVVENQEEVEKKILINTFRPISDLGYKVKMILDLKRDHRTYGLLEYNGFESKFIIKPLLRSELQRRRYEFETLYAHLVH